MVRARKREEDRIAAVKAQRKSFRLMRKWTMDESKIDERTNFFTAFETLSNAISGMQNSERIKPYKGPTLGKDQA